MSDLHSLEALQDRLLRLRELGYEWDMAALNLTRNGFAAGAIAQALRERGGWADLARQYKSRGLPYEEVVSRLRAAYAGEADVASALLAAGLTGADVLRVLLPLVKEGKALWGTIQVVVCHSPEDADFKEIRAVINSFGLGVEECLDHLAGPLGTREGAERRLGLR